MEVFIPATFEKSKSDRQEMRIFGYASTPDLDREQEQVIQDGLDISDFVNYGFFNLDHRYDTIVGYPDKENTKLTPEGLYVEGYILDTDVGRKLWDTAVALQKSNAPRRLGFSIEGKVLAKDSSGRILKAKVANVAITSRPCNPNATWEALVKSMSATLSTETGSALMQESLENGIRCLTKAIEGDLDILDSIAQWKDDLNKSKDPKDIRRYLMMFKGLYGSKLDDTTKKIMKEIQEGRS